jgi:hypothetical protein
VAAFVAMLAICLLDPKAHIAVDTRFAKGLLICLLESLIAMATIEFTLKSSRGVSGGAKTDTTAPKTPNLDR